MELAAGTMLLTKKEKLNQISVVVLLELMDVAKQLFEKFVFDLVEEKGKEFF